MAKALRSDSALAAFVLGLGLTLAFAGNALLKQWQAAEQHNQSFTFDHLLGLVASAVGLSVLCWWGLTFAIAFAASLLDRFGNRNGANFLSKFSPAFMLRIAVAVLSLNILGGSMAHAGAPPPEPAWQTSSSQSTAPQEPAWAPSSSVKKSPTPPRAAEAHASSSKAYDPRWQPQPQVVDPGLLSRQSTRSTTPPSEATVVVKDGDSLWSIAASRLGPLATDVDVALTWPRWYAANRAVIGSDPTALLPGQVLQPPAPY